MMFDERILEKLFKSMNEHVPVQRPNLADLLEMEEPVYSGKDGRMYHLDKVELKLISENIEKWDWARLKIPILLMTDTCEEQGCWKVMGKVEVRLISRLVHREPEREDEMRLFYPQLYEIRKMLPTSTNAMYMP
jgi:uncharacterized protein (UPF0216 family)